MRFPVRLTLRICSLAWLLAFPPAHAQVTPQDLEAATQVAAGWLAALDSRRYAEGYESLAPALKASMRLAAFEHSTYTVRVPLGALRQRVVKSAAPIQSPVEATKGDYIVVEYTSSFEGLAGTAESVLLAKQDGKWHPFSYSVKREGDLTSDQLRRVLHDRVEVARRGVGIVVGIVDKSGPRVVAEGRTRAEGGKAVDGDTPFEIGSLTKVFTAVLLADAVDRGEVQLNDPVSKYLPATLKALKAAGTDITLVQLATHTSGLPRIPSNMPMRDMDNPYADYTVAMLYEFLDAFEHPQPVREGRQYSNLGYGLLGHALALRAGMDYESLLRKRVLDPLGMKDTVIVMDAAMRDRFATAHRATLYPVAAWDIPALPGAGALRSTMNDMLKFAEVSVGLKPSPLAAAIRLAQGMQGVAWSAGANADVAVHAGATGGSNCVMAADRKEKRAVVVMGNSANPVTDIGSHLFLRSQPLLLQRPQVLRKEVKLADPAAFDRYVGAYSLTSDFSIAVTREGDRYFSQASRQPKLEIFPANETLFFLKVVEAALEFSTNAAGDVTHLTLLQGGAAQRGTRLGAPPAPR